MKSEFEVEDVCWVNKDMLEDKDELNCDIRIRNLGELNSGLVKNEKNCVRVELENKVFGVAPGQSAVFYLSDEVVGGGIIA